VPRKVQSESDFQPARTSPSGFAAPYNFSISLGDAGTCFHVECTPHQALKGLIVFYAPTWFKKHYY